MRCERRLPNQPFEEIAKVIDSPVAVKLCVGVAFRRQRREKGATHISIPCRFLRRVEPRAAEKIKDITIRRIVSRENAEHEVEGHLIISGAAARRNVVRPSFGDRIRNRGTA